MKKSLPTGKFPGCRLLKKLLGPVSEII